MSPKLLKKQQARQARETRKGAHPQAQFTGKYEDQVAPVSMAVPKELQPLHAAVMKWVSTWFMNSDTAKNGIDGFRADYGLGMGMIVGLAQLFVSLGVQQMGGMLSMRNMTIDNLDAAPVEVTLEDAVNEMVSSIEKYGLAEAVQMCTTYRCYEDWAQVFEVASGLYEDVQQDRFGMLVKFLYDGYSNQ